ncbi:MAG: hypothetical protein L0H93_23425 [Nocardioides sp.]|nr:hypothetical protein [Nocardioides sp.]
MPISERQASEILGEAGLSRRHARRALGWGLAGAGVVTRSAVLYDEDAVRALVRRPALTDEDLAEIFPTGVFVARLGETPEPGGLDLSAMSWDISVWARIRISLWIGKGGALPVLATVSGFVVDTAEATAVMSVPRGDRHRGLRQLSPSQLSLAESGAWSAAVAETRVPTGPGAAWRLWLPQ